MTLDYGEAVQVLRGIPLFAKLDPAKLKLLAFASEHLTFENGETLFQVGAAADSVYLIDEGEAEITVVAEEREIVISRLGKHDLFGEMAIFRRAPRSATVKASGRLGVLKIDAPMFLEVVTENPETARGVMHLLSDKIARTTERFEELEGRVRMLESISEPPRASS